MMSFTASALWKGRTQFPFSTGEATAMLDH